MHERVINTGLTGPVNKDILDSVMGQLSDGKWENTPAMAKYWRNAKVQDQGGNVVIVVKDGFGSGFNGKDETWIRNFFAGKIKEVVYDELDDKQWNRQDQTPLDYLSHGERPVTVSNAYQAYEILKGRNLKNKYAAPAAAKPEGAPAETPPMNPTVQATPESLVSHLLAYD